MTLPPRLVALERAARRRRMAFVAATSAPLVVAAAIIAFRLGGIPAALGAAATAIAVAVAWALRSTRAIDRAWIARRLDATRPDLENSAELLYPPAGPESALAPLQRALLMRRLDAGPVADIRERWPVRRVGHAWVVALAAIAAAHWWPATAPDTTVAQPETVVPGAPGTPVTRLLGARVDIEPPAYTGVAARHESALAFRAEAGSVVRWRLQFDREPAGVALVFHDGSEQALAAGPDGWKAQRTLEAATLYRIRVDGAPALADDALHRIDVVPDLAPELRVIAPDKTLTLVEAGQRNWALSFEASDDYGLGEARLVITLAKGSGEQVEVSERSVVLAGEGDARTRRYARTLDLASLGIAAGDDAIARLTLRDNRAPQPNLVRSPSLILRWPAEEAGETSGMDGLVERALPAYFRSQRQIIIDTEALIPQQPRLSADEFTSRSDAIGTDQKILRLRYGQFLGEEAETYGGEGDEHADEQGGEAAAPFGSPTDVLHTFGHAHDIAEAATLFDPQTRETLRAALAEMWQAELHLRLGQPKQALPYEYAALEYIKRVQQASRIYLSRVGLELPEVDESRRLTGERSGVRNRAGFLAPRTATDQTAVDAWRALESGAAPDWSAFDGWIAQHAAELPDALGLLAAVDAVRRDPGCRECRDKLRASLWPLLPVPPTGASVRTAPDESGSAYLDALGGSTP